MVPRRKPAATAALGLAMLAIAAPGAAAHPRHGRADREVTVMTRNVFLGADLAPAYAAFATPEGLRQLPVIVAGIFNPTPPLGLVQRTDFPTRARSLAAEIEAARPDLIGLQEAVVWRTQQPADPATPAETVAYDFLELLEAELAARGLHYRRVATVQNGDVELPSAAGLDVRLTDRDAILAREDRRGRRLRLSNVQTANFVNNLPISTTQGTFPLPRGWVSVDAGCGAGRSASSPPTSRSPRRPPCRCSRPASCSQARPRRRFPS